MAKKSDDSEVEILEDDNPGVDEETQDEPDKDESKSTDKEETEDTEDESEEESKEEPTGDESKKRFTQVPGETQEEYLQNLEKAYAESSSEGQRLNEQIKKFMSEIANEPAEDSPALADQPPTSPALAFAEQQMNQTMKKEYDDFVSEHSELESDPSINKKVFETVGLLAKAAWANGEVLSMGKGLRMAWAYHELDNSSDEDAAAAAKTLASTGKTNSSRKSASGKTQFTKSQIEKARKLDPSLAGKSDAKVEEELAKFK